MASCCIILPRLPPPNIGCILSDRRRQDISAIITSMLNEERGLAERACTSRPGCSRSACLRRSIQVDAGTEQGGGDQMLLNDAAITRLSHRPLSLGSMLSLHLQGRIVPDMKASDGASDRAPVAGHPTAWRTLPCSLVGLQQQRQLQWHHRGLLGGVGVEQSVSAAGYCRLSHKCAVQPTSPCLF